MRNEKACVTSSTGGWGEEQLPGRGGEGQHSLPPKHYQCISAPILLKEPDTKQDLGEGGVSKNSHWDEQTLVCLC